MGWANLIAQVRGRGRGEMIAKLKFLSSLVTYNATVLKVVSLYPSYIDQQKQRIKAIRASNFINNSDRQI